MYMLCASFSFSYFISSLYLFYIFRFYFLAFLVIFLIKKYHLALIFIKNDEKSVTNIFLSNNLFLNSFFCINSFRYSLALNC